MSGSVPYFRQLDGLRAICILFTVMNHVEGHPGYLDGSVGVDVFFALSGFLITNLLLADMRQDGRPCLKCFYVRRLFRIVPLYYVVFGLYVAAAHALHAIGQAEDVFAQMQHAWPSVLAFMSEYRPAEAGTFFGHAWTLGIEEKYYLLWPLLFIGLVSLPRRWQIGLLAAVLCAEVSLLPTLEMRGYAGLTIGSLVAIMAHEESTLTKRLFGSPALYAAAMFVAYLAVIATDGGRMNILMSLTAAMMIASVVRHQGAVSRILSWRPLAAAGKLTYGVYLIHVLVVNAVQAALQAAGVPSSWIIVFVLAYGLSLLAAAVLKLTIEDPMIAVGRRLSTRWAKAARPELAGAAADRSVAV